MSNAGRVIPTGAGVDIDLRVSGVFDDLDRDGVAVALALRHPDYGGVQVRGARLWGDRGGFSWSVGADLGTAPTLGGLVLTALVLGALQKLGEELGDAVVGNQ